MTSLSFLQLKFYKQKTIMAQLFSASLDVSKISKDKLVKGEKGTYLNITISINDEADKYGNVLTITESQTQEEREAKSNRNYLANGKLVWSTEGGSTAKKTPATPTPPPAAAPVVEEGDDLPF
jgi:hypothetical protein